MRASVERTGTVRCDLRPEEAFPLFTPEGERRWVEGWDPAYPAGGPPAPAPGVVFIVEKAEGASTWIVTRFEEEAGRAAYAYVLPGHRATTVEVEVEKAPGDGSVVRVTYRMTSLAPAADAAVEAFGERFEAFLEEWEEALRRAGY